MRFSFRSLPAQLVPLLLGAVQTCSAGRLAAWWTDIGPQVLVQNTSTTAIMYSMCNSNNTPIFPTDPPNLLSLSYQPRNGTAVAGVGWWDTKTTWASIFYQDTKGDLINSYLKCDWDTGLFATQGSWVISGDVPIVNDVSQVNNATGLASLVLGSTSGYRVYFHDPDWRLHQISYTNDAGWGYSGIVSQDPMAGSGIATQFTGSNNISVATPKDDSNIEVSRYNSDGLWHISTFPRPLQSTTITNNTNTTTSSGFQLSSNTAVNFTLPAWNASAASSLGLAVDHSFVRTVYYIGTDRALHAASNVNFTWRLSPANQSAAAWPLADGASADLAVASDFTSSTVRIFYYAGGGITQVSYDPDAARWVDAAALPTFNATAVTTEPTPSATATPDSGGSGGGLSAGAKAGIGIGVSLGVIGLAGIAGTFLFLRRRRARANAAAEAAAAAQQQQMTGPGGQPAYYDYAGQQQHPGYGGSPPPGSVSAYTDYNGSQVGTPGVAGWADPKDPKGYPPGYAAVPPPQELEGPRPMYEMPEQHYSHELVGEGHVTEMPGSEPRK
ncbi:Protein crumbs 3 [Pleurostoma richardsiae]|uniref:Protein crumbs 3 n=1 Tax=Pleurostoma richardsiae TaxID=41990 RepID=A0AA38VVX1_9PEZI|nr:Protein crumbs 3 [Pleurostoma richardsiae]